MQTVFGRVVPALDRVSHHPMLSTFNITIELLDGVGGWGGDTGGHTVYSGLWFNFEMEGNWRNTNITSVVHIRDATLFVGVLFQRQTGHLVSQVRPADEKVQTSLQRC